MYISTLAALSAFQNALQQGGSGHVTGNVLGLLSRARLRRARRTPEICFSPILCFRFCTSRTMIRSSSCFDFDSPIALTSSKKSRLRWEPDMMYAG